jgi:NAD(P)-dependent dehydrogenase (short-subunit alcohol dehydrogenase family)
MEDLSGLKVLVTGGASGIGLAVVRLFARHGGRVCALDRLAPEDAAGALPPETAYVQADVTDGSAVVRAVDEAIAGLGGIDVLVNNAGIGAEGGVEANEDAEWLHVLDVNLLGLVRVTRAALPALHASESAAIVNTCSVAAITGLPNRALYSASKGAVLALTRAMAADLVGAGIRVNAVNPGTADTPWVNRLLGASRDPEAERAALMARQPHGRLVSADEVARAIAYLASPTSGSTTGTALTVDGGMSALRLRTPPPVAE